MTRKCVSLTDCTLAHELHFIVMCCDCTIPACASGLTLEIDISSAVSMASTTSTNKKKLESDQLGLRHSSLH